MEIPDLGEQFINRVHKVKLTHFKKESFEDIGDGLYASGCYDNPYRFGIPAEPRKNAEQLIGFEAILWHQFQNILKAKSNTKDSTVTAVDFGGRMGYSFRRMALEAEKQSLISSGKARFIITNAGKFNVTMALQSITSMGKDTENIEKLFYPTQNLVETIDQTMGSNLRQKVSDIDLFVASYSLYHSKIPETDLWLIGKSLSEYGTAFFNPKLSDENELIGISNMKKLGLKQIHIPDECKFTIMCKPKSPMVFPS